MKLIKSDKTLVQGNNVKVFDTCSVTDNLGYLSVIAA